MKNQRLGLSKVSRARWVLCCSLSAAFASNRAQAAPGEATSSESGVEQALRAEQAETLAQLGMKAFEGRRYQEAISQLRESLRVFASYRAACGLGQVELHLSRYRDAAEHLDTCLRSYPSTGDTTAQQRILKGLDEARRHVFSLAVRCDKLAAQVFVDGAAVGETPVSRDLFLAPGKHQVVVKFHGQPDQELRFFGPSGGQRDWVVLFAKSKNAAAPAPSADSDAPAYVLTGGIALTAVLGLGGLLAYSRAEVVKERLGAFHSSFSNCEDSRVRECGAEAPLQQRETNLRHSAYGLWIAAGATAVLTPIVYFVLAEGTQGSKLGDNSLIRQLGATFLPDRFQLSWKGEF